MIPNRFAAERRSVGMCLLGTVVTLAIGAASLGAQTVPTLTAGRTDPPSTKTLVHRKTSPAKAVAPAPAPDPPPATPPAPEMPKWPLNDAPAPPSVHWDSHGLQVDAPNSSLRQILDEVASTTGAKVEGLGTDERVFGEYGPGPARDVISQILHGSNYNVLMLGDQGEGTPREIILSQRSAGSTQPAQAANRQNPQDDDSDQPAVVAEPEEPNRQPMVPAMNQQMNQPPMNQPAPMTPQQRMLEMQRQQMQMQQQQQQNTPVQPPQQQPQ